MDYALIGKHLRVKKDVSELKLSSRLPAKPPKKLVTSQVDPSYS
jgi:hypothetical protein